jgi:alcohol dehydrogenase
MITANLYTPSKLIMIDLDENRLKNALDLGATHAFKSDGDVVKKVMDLTDGFGVDTVIEAVGIPATFQICQDIIAPGGTIANLGVHGKSVQLHLESLWDKSISTRVFMLFF